LAVIEVIFTYVVCKSEISASNTFQARHR